MGLDNYPDHHFSHIVKNQDPLWSACNIKLGPNDRQPLGVVLDGGPCIIDISTTGYIRANRKRCFVMDIDCFMVHSLYKQGFYISIQIENQRKENAFNHCSQRRIFQSD